MTGEKWNGHQRIKILTGPCVDGSGAVDVNVRCVPIWWKWNPPRIEGDTMYIAIRWGVVYDRLQFGGNTKDFRDGQQLMRTHTLTLRSSYIP